MVKIRLRRMGKKKEAIYRIVVADERSPRDGRFIEEVGTYNPNTDPSTFTVDLELVEKWIKNGAKPTDSVERLIKLAKAGKAQPSQKKNKHAAQAEEAAPEAVSEAAPEADAAEAPAEEAVSAAEAE